MNNTYIVIAVITVILMILYINDINNKLKALDDKEHLSKGSTRTRVLSETQLIIMITAIVLIAVIMGITFFFKNKSIAPIGT
jgi:hypothetical protein